MLFVLLLCMIVVNSSSAPIPCVATEDLDSYFKEQWDFRKDSWQGKTFSFASSDYNIPPMSGTYIFQINFCEGVHVYVGDQTSGALGWSFGKLEFFMGVDVTPPIPPSAAPFSPSTPTHIIPIHEYSAFKEFVQIYTDGDTGAPCAYDARSAFVNIYCGQSKANCTQVPGNKGPECLNGGDTHNGFCLCGIEYNTTFGICNGLNLNILSNACPSSVTVPIVIPSPPPEYSSRTGIGIAFAVIAVILILVIIGGYVYNFVVHHKRGCTALPFYDTCTGKKVDPTYQVAPASYGSISV